MAKKYLIPAQERLGLDREEAAEYIGVSATLFDTCVSDGRMPAAKMINSRKVWHRPSLDKAFVNLPDEEHDGESASPFAV
jgi:hypothetical protein